MAGGGRPVVLPVDSVNLDYYDTQELLSLRDRINLKLPKSSLASLDLMEELVTQFLSGKKMLDDAKNEPLNQRAQTMNAIVAVLKTLTEAQKSFYSAERLQKFEKVATELFKEYPDAYERYLEAMEGL